MKWPLRLLLLLLAMLSFAIDAQAQWRSNAFDVEQYSGHVELPAAVQEVAEEPGIGRVITGGVVLGLTGFALGGWLAASAADDCDSHEFCELEAAFYGAAAGGTFGMAFGVHQGNRRRGAIWRWIF